MKYEFQDHRDYDEERVKRSTSSTARPGEWTVRFLGEVFIPAIIGALVGFFVLAFIPTLIMDMVQNHGSADQAVSRVLSHISRDMGKMAEGNFSNVKLWLAPLFGFAIVVVVKLANNDKH